MVPRLYVLCLSLFGFLGALDARSVGSVSDPHDKQLDRIVMGDGEGEGDMLSRRPKDKPAGPVWRNN